MLGRHASFGSSVKNAIATTNTPMSTLRMKASVDKAAPSGQLLCGCYAESTYALGNLSTAHEHPRQSNESPGFCAPVVSTPGAWFTGEITAGAAITAIVSVASVYMGRQGYFDGRRAEAARQ